MGSEDLTELPGVGPVTASSLSDAGFDSLPSIAVASPAELSNAVDIDKTTAAEIIQAAREESNIGGFETGASTLTRRSSIEKLTTGLDDLDELLGGGIETQSITQFYGNEKSGRSTISHQLAVRAQLPPSAGGLGGSAAYVNTRGKFDPERIRTMVAALDEADQEALAEQYDVENDADAVADEVLDHILVSSPVNTNAQILDAEDLKEEAEDLEQTGPPLRIVLVDSITHHFRAEYQGRGELAERQQKLNKHVHDLSRIGHLHNAAVVFTNAVSSTGSPYGGAVLNHQSSFRLQLKKTSGEKRRISLRDAPNLGHGEVGAYIEDEGFVGE